MSEPYLSIRNVTKTFGDFVALDDVNLDINKGELVCFLGPSGCGKTTLLRAIAGLDKQSEGHIYMNGRDVSDLPPAERDFGIVFQSYALFPNLKVKDNVSYGLQGRGMSRAEQANRVTELLDVVGLANQAEKYPTQLSGGQQQRIALARALATSPGLLLLDEPLSALDARVRAKLRKEIKSLQHQIGITTIMVTHDQEEALTMADRILVMKDGRIMQIGSPHAIYSNPESPFVANFIGEMNLISAQHAGEGKVRIGNVEMTAETAHIDSDQVLVAIRPEDIRVHSANGDEALNSVMADIDESEYLGSFLRTTFSSEHLGDTKLRADLPINLVIEKELASGMQVKISLPQERLRVYETGIIQ